MTTEERIARLERQVKVLVAVLITGVGLCLIAAAAQKDNRVVEAEEFHLLDSQGKTRAALRMTTEGPMLGFRDEDGHNEAVLGITKSHGPGLTLFDYVGGKSRTRAVFVCGNKTGLVLWDQDGKVVFTTDK